MKPSEEVCNNSYRKSMSDRAAIAGLPPTLAAACALLFVATAFAGWQLGGPRAAEAPTADTTDSGHQAKHAQRPDHRRTRFGTPDHAQSAVSGIAAIPDPRERLRATVALVESIPLEDLGDWLEQRWFEQRGFELTLFNQLAKERWREEDPEGFLAWASEEENGTFQQMLASWAESDPQRIIDYYREQTEVQSYQVFQSLTEIAKHDPRAALEGLGELRASSLHSDEVRHYADELFRQIAESSPEQLEGVLDSLDDLLRPQAEAALFGQRMRSDLSSALDELADRPDGWSLFAQGLQSDSALASRALEHIATLPESWMVDLRKNPRALINHDTAQQWLSMDLAALGFSEQEARQARGNAIQHLAYSDSPGDALEHLQTADVDDWVRTNVIQNSFSRHARDADMVELLLSKLDNETDREAAREIVAAATQPADILQARPTDAATWIEQAQRNVVSGNGIPQLSLDARELDQLHRDFNELRGGDKDTIAMSIAYSTRYTNGSSHEVSGAAIAHLLAHPPDEEERDSTPLMRELNLEQLASTHGARLATDNPERAREWVATLPEGDARTWAVRNVALTWSQYDPQSSERWIQSLPPETRDDVRAFLKNPDSRPGR